MTRPTRAPSRAQWRDRLADLPVAARLELMRANSGLPGPRANLSLLEAAADLADPTFVDALLDTDEEYLVACGASGLGALLVTATATDTDRAARLHELARDDRWRVREGVAMALQRLGDAGRADGAERLAELTERWSAARDPLVQRAVVAGICEPRLLDTPAAAARARLLCERATTMLLDQDPSTRRRPAWRTLRQALGYCWSVAVAADPAGGLPAFTELARRADTAADPDLRWIVRTNRSKARLAKLLV